MLDRANDSAAVLDGRRVLIVEDEPFIAYDLADAIESAGGVVIGPALSLRDAVRLIAEDKPDAAILDVNLPDGDIGPVIAALAGEGIVMVVHTGAGLTPELREEYPGLRVFAKPTPPPVLAHVIAASFQAGRHQDIHHG